MTFFSPYKDWIIKLHVKHNIIEMNYTTPLTGLNSFEVISYYFSADFWQYLEHRITNIIFQLVQSLRIVRVNTIFTIASQKQIQSC